VRDLDHARFRPILGLFAKRGPLLEDVSVDVPITDRRLVTSPMIVEPMRPRESDGIVRPPRHESAPRGGSRRSVVVVCFLLSGFTALLYQTVWMRLALAHFGVNASTVATVLTAFMLGGAVGAYLAGRWTARIERRLSLGGLELYAAAELAVAAGGLVVPVLFDHARAALLSLGAADGPSYTVASAGLLVAALLPFCIAMGATFPAAIGFLARSDAAGQDLHAFSALYLPNLAGASIGVLAASLVLIETLGFRGTLRVGVALNVAVAVLAFGATRPGRRSTDGRRSSQLPDGIGAATPTWPAPWAGGASPRAQFAALFVTGLATMGMEVVWTRLYPAFIGTFVYSFAAILATYLVASTLGSLVYRRYLRGRATQEPWRWWHALCLASVLPLVATSASLPLPGVLRVVLGLAPFSAILGLLTPWLLDTRAGGDPGRAGSAYAINLAGCVLGPLVAGFVLLPLLGNRLAYAALATPLFAMGFLGPVRRGGRRAAHALTLTLAGLAWVTSTGFEDTLPTARVRHDSVATVVATGTGMQKALYVNGVNMTALTPITKMMVHFPLAHLDAERRAPDGLVICFGMGTSLRSLASWGGGATAVELVPSVPALFPFYFPGDSLLTSARARVEIDDGRRFLDRARRQFDLITIDPPPPVEAAASSLLYSTEFYASASRRLTPGGILQAWYPHPGGDRTTLAAVTQSLLESFPHVRAFKSVAGWGVHYLAAHEPIPRPDARELLARMPDAAVRDMTEWGERPAIDYLAAMLDSEIDPRALASPQGNGRVPVVSDDRPVNEFFLLRRQASGLGRKA
jgi:spermidine synthase